MNNRQPRGRAGLVCGAVALVSVLALSACGPGSAVAEAPLAGSPIGGPFTLQNADGETVTRETFEGSWRLVYLGFTFCPDICPTDMQRAASAYRTLESESPALAARLQPIFISIDPERDTPGIAQEFAAAFHPDFVGLSGTEDQVQDAANAFAAYRAKGETRDDGFYLMDHSAFIYLLDADSNPINFYSHEDSAAEIAADIESWMTS
ncbi:MAG: SCO family protein [Pacificimonas sp.]|jgi:protein SCO1/2|nr:SCO family protein [Pacificimonas sp.]